MRRTGWSAWHRAQFASLAARAAGPSSQCRPVSCFPREGRCYHSARQRPQSPSTHDVVALSVCKESSQRASYCPPLARLLAHEPAQLDRAQTRAPDSGVPSNGTQWRAVDGRPLYNPLAALVSVDPSRVRSGIQARRPLGPCQCSRDLAPMAGTRVSLVVRGSRHLPAAAATCALVTVVRVARPCMPIASRHGTWVARRTAKLSVARLTILKNHSLYSGGLGMHLSVLRRGLSSKRAVGEPPGTRTPNLVIKSHLLCH